MRPAPRGSVVVIVIWSLAIAAVIVAATQLIAFRQATMGREALARVQARWAARAGIEETLAVLEYHTENPDPDDALQMFLDLEACADGELSTGSWSIRHVSDGLEKKGPLDESSKVNLNRVTRGQLLNLPNMTFDVADAIVDWRDADSEVGGLGAERDYYLNRDLGYTPRNADFRSIAELEMVAGAWPEYVRGEDANLNGRLDPNENDGNETPPDDDADGQLDEGWAGVLTARTTLSKIGMSGEARVNLRSTTPEILQERFGVDPDQAKALAEYMKNPQATMESLLATDLGTLAQGSGRNQRAGTGMPSGDRTGGQAQTSGRRSGRSSGGQSRAGGQSTVKALSTDQLRKIFAEGMVLDPTKETPGKVNLNTVSARTLREVLGLDSSTIDAILNLRAGRQGGITSIVDLIGTNRITPQSITGLATQADVTSQVFTINSRGRSESTGLEVEITALIDRSTLPARILEYRER
jgi:type II secretory pathway component PulK